MSGSRTSVFRSPGERSPSREQVVASPQLASPSSPSGASPPPRATGLREKLFARAGRLIQQLDEVAEKCRGLHLEFPQIIVVGEEASGKSTVLERIAMLQFFPRDRTTAICTRMPMRLRLKHKTVPEMNDFCRENKLNYFEGGAFIRFCYEDKLQNIQQWSQFYDVKQVEVELKRFMEEAVRTRNGATVGVVEDVLVTEVTSNLVPNLSLVDLPGIVGARIQGEPEHIMEQTRNLVEKFLQQPHTLVLAVVPATAKPRTALCMQLIQKYKKEDMTLGVLTMADKAHQGLLRPDDPFFELKAMLDGTALHYVPLPMGYVAVKNRDVTLHHDISLAMAAEDEIKWFDQHLPGYRQQGKVSSDVLTEKLVTMLCSYVREQWVPVATKAVQAELEKSKKSLEDLGEDPKASALLHRLLSGFSTEASQLMDRLAEEFQAKVDSSTWLEQHQPNAGLLSRVKSFNNFQTKVRESIEGLITSVQTIVLSSVMKLYASNKPPLRFERFSKLHTALTQLLTNEIAKWTNRTIVKLNEALPTVSLMMQARSQRESWNYKPLVSHLTCQHVFVPLENLLQSVTGLAEGIARAQPSIDLLEEKQEVRTKRLELQKECQDFQQVLKELSELL